MTNLEEIYTQVQEYEAKIQASVGEKTALSRQKEQQALELARIEQECQNKFGCSLSELEAKEIEIETDINRLVGELRENIKKLE
jgi:hypothetical protein